MVIACTFLVFLVTRGRLTPFIVHQTKTHRTSLNGGHRQVFPSCSYFGIETIQRVGRTERNRAAGELWAKGFYPYQPCPVDDGLQDWHQSLSPTKFAQPVAVLTVMDSSYLDVLASWAHDVRNNGHACFVVAVDVAVCAEVKRVGCGCFTSELKVNNLRRQSGWHTNRVTSVRKRFEGALSLLDEGYSVFMHDADVLFRPSGLMNLTKYASWVMNNQRLKKFTFLIQDNGARDTAFDGLNWGFVWMTNTPSAKGILRCTLERWNDPAFGCVSKGPCNDYYLRSQPRISHILELAISSERDVSACMLPEISTFNAVHLTGYPSVASKLTCAKALGILRERQAVPTVAYVVPPEADIFAQKQVLQVALYLADSFGAKVEIPATFYKSQPIEFCDIFDVKGIAERVTSTSTASCSKYLHTIDAQTVLELSELKAHQHRVCVDFRDLRNAGSEVSLLAQRAFIVPVCDPSNPVYKATHSCIRENGTDEIIPAD